MKKIAGAVIILIIVAIGGVLIATSHNSSGNATSDMAGMKMNQSTSASHSSQNNSPVATNSVNIADFAFSPADITVKAGTKVTWTNQDSTPHTVTETDGQAGPNSDSLAQGQAYSFTFTKPGIYHYNCSIHTEMIGTVTVTN